MREHSREYSINKKGNRKLKNPKCLKTIENLSLIVHKANLHALNNIRNQEEKKMIVYAKKILLKTICVKTKRYFRIINVSELFQMEKKSLYLLITKCKILIFERKNSESKVN